MSSCTLGVAVAVSAITGTLAILSIISLDFYILGGNHAPIQKYSELHLSQRKEIFISFKN